MVKRKGSISFKQVYDASRSKDISYRVDTFISRHINSLEDLITQLTVTLGTILGSFVHKSDSEEPYIKFQEINQFLWVPLSSA